MRLLLIPRLVPLLAAGLALQVGLHTPTLAAQQAPRRPAAQPATHPLTCNPAIGCTAGNPPTIWMTPDPRAQTYDYHTTSLNVTISWCDDGGLNQSSRSVVLNGNPVTTTYTVQNFTDGCWAYAYSAATFTFQAGRDSLLLSIEDNFGQLTTLGGSFRYDPRRLLASPKKGTAQVLPDTIAVQAFTLQNNEATSQTYAVTALCASRLACVADSSHLTIAANSKDSVHVAYATGPYNGADTVQVRFADSSVAIDVDTGSVIASATVPRTTIAFAANNTDDQQAGLCANDCFGATYAVSSVPYVSLGTPRGATLVFTGDHLAPKPFVRADVTLAAGAPSPSELRLEVLRNGAPLKFVNGDTILHFASGPTVLVPGQAIPVRLVGQLASDSALATGMDPVTIQATAVYTDHSEVAVDTTKLMIIDLGTPDLLPLAGWTVAGLQHLFYQSDSTVLIVEGDGSGVYFACKLYTGGCAGPTGDFSKLTSAGSGGSLTYTRTYPDSSRVVFNNLGQMTAQRDRWGNETDITYDSTTGHVLSIEDPYMTYNGGSTRTAIAFQYGTGTITIEMPGPCGTAPTTARGTVVAYDSNHRVTSITDPDSVVTHLSYDGRGRLARVIDRRGDTTSYTYDTVSWKLTTVTLPTIAVDAGSGGSTVNAKPVVKYQPWQTIGSPIHSTVSTAAPPVRIDTLMAAVTDADSVTSRFTVDRWGQPLVVVDALHDTTTIQRTGPFATQVTSPLGQVDTYSYSGPFLTQSHPHDQTATTYDYDAWGMVNSVSGGGGPTQTIVYDPTHHWLIGKIDGAYPDTTFLDTHGRDTASVDPLGHRTQVHYDATFGTPDSTVAAAGQWTAVTLNAYGLDSVSRASGRPATTTFYDVLNRPTRSYGASGDSATVYRYDALYTIATTDPKGQVYKSLVNALGWTTRSYDPADTVGTYSSAQYSAGGLVKHARNQRGQWIAFQYDPLGRLTSRRDPLAPADSFQYLDHGRVVVATNSIATDTIATGLDGSDTVTTVLHGIAYRRVHTKTAGVGADTTTITASPSGPSFATRTNYWSQAVGTLDSIRVGASAVRYQYNGELLDSSVTYPGFSRSIETTSTHDWYDSYYPSLALDTLFGVQYAYDSTGRIVSESRANGYQSGITYDVGHYAYNPDGALARYARGSTHNRSCDPTYGCTFAGESTYQTYGYPTYDPALNLRVQVDSTDGDAKDSAAFAIGDRVTSWAGATYAYDSDGNRSERTVGSTNTTYTWDGGGDLLSVSDGTTTVSYAYDALGQLVRRETNGVVDRYFLWDNGQLVAELDSSATTKLNEFAYQPGTVDQPLARITSAYGTQFYQLDGRGNVMGLAGGSGGTQSLRFGPWGDLEQQVGDSLVDTRLGWKGLVWEGGVTGLYYVRARWYDPATRSFLAADPLGIGGGRNTYAYADNDPINGTDPAGLSRLPCLEVGYFDLAYSIDGSSGLIRAPIWFPVACDDGGDGGPPPDAPPFVSTTPIVAGIPPAMGLPYAGAGGAGGGGIGHLIRNGLLAAAGLPSVPTTECVEKSAIAAASIALDLLGGKELTGAIVALGKAGFFDIAAGTVSIALSNVQDLTRLSIEAGRSVNIASLQRVGAYFSVAATANAIIGANVIVRDALTKLVQQPGGSFSLWDLVPIVGSARAVYAAAEAC